LANPSLLNLCLPRCSRNTRSQLFLYMLGYWPKLRAYW
jgi:hypothetical protein